MSPPLIQPRLRRWVAVAMVVGAVLTAVLAAIVFHRSSTSFDASVGGALYRHLGPAWVEMLLGFSEPAISFALLGMLVVLAALHRRWNVTALAIAGPILAIFLTEVVLKPVVGRTIGAGAVQLTGSYPSGHETGVLSTAWVIVVACGQLRMPRWGRAALATGMLVWAVIAAVGLVRGFLHYTTDTFGALGVATVAVLGAALAIDRLSSPVARSLARTSRAA